MATLICWGATMRRVLMDGYDGELLKLALNLGHRLLPAFDTASKIPLAWVNLRTGVPPNEVRHTCTAGAGTLLLEFTLLSRLTVLPLFVVFHFIFYFYASLNSVTHSVQESAASDP